LQELFPDPSFLLKLARTRMPFGKFAGTLLVDLPEPYLVWFRQEGFPEGELGELLSLIHISEPTRPY
jgi:uncharacterized protein (DUF3820 family)